MRKDKIKALKQSSSLDDGSIWKVFKKFWIPALVTALIAGTFTIFDTIFVASGYHSGIMGSSLFNFQATSVSELGVAAMSYTVPFTFIIIGVGIMYGSAISQKVARAKANGDIEKAQKLMNSYFPTLYIAGIVLLIVFVLLAKPLVWMGSGFQQFYIENWFNNPELLELFKQAPNASTLTGQQLSQAAWFIRIQAFGAIPFMTMVSGTMMLRVVGNPNKGTLYSSYALFINIILDILFINILGMNLVGASIATVLAQVTVMMLYRNYFYKKSEIKITENDWHKAKSDLKENRKIGATAFILQAIMGVILISTTMGIGIVFYGNQDVITIYQSSFQGFYALFSFANMIVVGTALTMQPIVAYNHEKGNSKRVEDTKNLALKLSFTIGAIYTLIMLFFPQITSLFVKVGVDNVWMTGYSQRILQMLFLAYLPLIYTTITSIFLASTQQIDKAKWIIFIKPLVLLPLVLIFGFAMKGVPVGTWVGGIIGDSLQVVPLNINKPGLIPYAGNYLPLGLFWAFLIAEMPGFVLSLISNLNSIDVGGTSIKNDEKISKEIIKPKTLNKNQYDEIFNYNGTGIRDYIIRDINKKY